MICRAVTALCPCGSRKVRQIYPKFTQACHARGRLHITDVHTLKTSKKVAVAALILRHHKLFCSPLNREVHTHMGVTACNMAACMKHSTCGGVVVLPLKRLCGESRRKILQEI